jgi:hypothetical protein
MIKFSLFMAEIFSMFGRCKEAADVYVRLATVLSDKAACKALFFEQAGFCYLALGQYRKFAFNLKLASTLFKGNEL